VVDSMTNLHAQACAGIYLFLMMHAVKIKVSELGVYEALYDTTLVIPATVTSVLTEIVI